MTKEVSSGPGVRLPKKRAASAFTSQKEECYSCKKKFNTDEIDRLPIQMGREKFTDHPFCKSCGQVYLNSFKRIDLSLPHRVVFSMNDTIRGIKEDEINAKVTRSDFILKAVKLLEKELKTKKYHEI